MLLDYYLSCQLNTYGPKICSIALGLRYETRDLVWQEAAAAAAAITAPSKKKS